jgi:hypothetical protein
MGKGLSCPFPSVFIARHPDTVALYSLQFGKRSRLGQRYGLQSTTLTSYFYNNNY